MKIADVKKKKEQIQNMKAWQKQVKKREKEQAKEYALTHRGTLKWGPNQLLIVFFLPFYFLFQFLSYSFKTLVRIIRRFIPNRYVIRVLTLAFIALCAAETVDLCPFHAGLWGKILFALVVSIGLLFITKIFYEAYKIVDIRFELWALKNVDTDKIYFKLTGLNNKNKTGQAFSANWILDKLLYTLKFDFFPGLFKILEYILGAGMIFLEFFMVVHLLFPKLPFLIADGRFSMQGLYNVILPIKDQIIAALYTTFTAQDYLHFVPYAVSVLFLIYAIGIYITGTLEGLLIDWGKSWGLYITLIEDDPNELGYDREAYNQDRVI